MVGFLIKLNQDEVGNFSSFEQKSIKKKKNPLKTPKKNPLKIYAAMVGFLIKLNQDEVGNFSSSSFEKRIKTMQKLISHLKIKRFKDGWIPDQIELG